MKPVDSFGIVILAAGQSKRLGRPKQLLTYEGKNLLQKVVDLSSNLQLKRKVLVLGAFEEQITKAIHTHDVELIVNKNWLEGMSSSIQVGVQELTKDDAIENILFLLSDQPFLTDEILEKLISMHIISQSPITACQYKDQVGVPVIFSKPFFSELMTLSGEQGAKKIVKRHLDQVQVVDFEKGYFDIDTEENYKKLLEIANDNGRSDHR